MNEDAEQDESLQDAIRSYGLRQQIASLHKEIVSELKSGVSAPYAFRTIARTSLRIAAGVLVLAFCATLYLYFSTSGEKLFTSHYTTYAASEERGERDNNSHVKTNFGAGQKYLQNGDAANAVSSFQKVLRENASSGGKSLNDDAEYYLALSYLRLTNVNNALPLFERIYHDKNHLYHDRVSGWFVFRLRLLAYKQR